MMDRRTALLTLTGGAIAAGSLAQTAPADPLVQAWEAYKAVEGRLKVLHSQLKPEDEDTPEIERYEGVQSDLEQFILNTRPTTRDGALAQVEWVASELERGYVFEGHGPLLRQATAALAA